MIQPRMVGVFFSGVLVGMLVCEDYGGPTQGCHRKADEAGRTTNASPPWVIRDGVRDPLILNETVTLYIILVGPVCSGGEGRSLRSTSVLIFDKHRSAIAQRDHEMVDSYGDARICVEGDHPYSVVPAANTWADVTSQSEIQLDG